MVLHYCCFNFLGPSNIAMQTQNTKHSVCVQQEKCLVRIRQRALVKINVNFSNVPCNIVLLILFQVNLRYLQITYRNFLRESSQTVLFPISLGHVGTLKAHLHPNGLATVCYCFQMVLLFVSQSDWL